jgi:hypothetical protein
MGDDLPQVNLISSPFKRYLLTGIKFADSLFMSVSKPTHRRLKGEWNMKRLLLVMVSVLVIAIPAFAQIWVGPMDSEIQNDSLGVVDNNADYGPIELIPLMIYTGYEPDGITPYFFLGQIIGSVTYWDMRGTGQFRIKVETRDSRGMLIHRGQVGWPTPLEVSSDVFQPWALYSGLPPDVPERPGYYTVEVIYIDVTRGNTSSHWRRDSSRHRTRNTWSHETKFHVSASE